LFWLRLWGKSWSFASDSHVFKATLCSLFNFMSLNLLRLSFMSNVRPLWLPCWRFKTSNNYKNHFCHIYFLQTWSSWKSLWQNGPSKKTTTKHKQNMSQQIFSMKRYWSIPPRIVDTSQSRCPCPPSSSRWSSSGRPSRNSVRRTWRRSR